MESVYSPGNSRLARLYLNRIVLEVVVHLAHPFKGDRLLFPEDEAHLPGLSVKARRLCPALGALLLMSVLAASFSARRPGRLLMGSHAHILLHAEVLSSNPVCGTNQPGRQEAVCTLRLCSTVFCSMHELGFVFYVQPWCMCMMPWPAAKRRKNMDPGFHILSKKHMTAHAGLDLHETQGHQEWQVTIAGNAFCAAPTHDYANLCPQLQHSKQADKNAQLQAMRHFSTQGPASSLTNPRCPPAALQRQSRLARDPPQGSWTDTMTAICLTKDSMLLLQNCGNAAPCLLCSGDMRCTAMAVAASMCIDTFRWLRITASDLCCSSCS